MSDPARTAVPAELAGQLGLDMTGSPRPRRRRAWIIAAVAVPLVVCVLMLRARSGAGPVRFRTEPVLHGRLTVTISATGILHPTNQVDVGSELSGVVRSVEATYNQRVVQGQVLARLDTTKLEAQAAQSRATLAYARAKVANAKATVEEDRLKLERLQQVRERSGGKLPAPSDLDAADAALARARADLAANEASATQSRATLEASQVDLRKSAVRSPVNGVVLNRSVEPGQTVAAALQAPVLFTVAEDLRRMKLRVDVDEADVARVKVGQDARFTVDAFSDRRFTAKVAQVRLGATTTNGVVTYTAVLAVDNDDFALLPGMTATVQIVVERVDDALLVPTAALRFGPGHGAVAKGRGAISNLLPRSPAMQPKEGSGPLGSDVYVLRNGTLKAIPVKTGASEGENTRIVSGDLAPGQQVVVAEGAP